MPEESMAIKDIFSEEDGCLTLIQISIGMPDEGSRYSGDVYNSPQLTVLYGERPQVKSRRG